ncbi:YgfZ/GcvT domain-containing protein [Pasteurella sp. PK-2025]|uniref:CAF17-like 4Fe-4S cluster assembly/insertion protein YgfZ n=1 Tax=Pasteurella sp. PK-2025 TaxID=3413133 RepID=UPI003C71ECE8
MTYTLLTTTQPTLVCNLQQYGLIEIKGEDAEKYLQGQVSCDVNKLDVGQSTLTAHCDPKGKITSLFRLIRTDSQCFYALLKRSILPTALELLKKYAVFSKVSFTQLDWEIIGLAGEATRQAFDTVGAQIRVDIECQQARTLLIHPTSLNITPNTTHQAWDLLDIQDGIPMLSPETQGEFIPQALNLQSIEQAISFQKGCYIGQEIVARAKYRGANKRAMFTLVGETLDIPATGTEVEMQLENNWRKTGKILNAINIEGVLWLQVVMNNQLEENASFRLTENSPLTLFPLPYELV